jgi:DNA-binding LacI/PurR family transcriptional regulator
MLAAERRARILRIAERDGFVRVADLVADLGVTRMTVRRDLDSLHDAGQLEKVYGGATLPPQASGGPVEAAESTAANQGLRIGLLIPTPEYYFKDIAAGVREALEESAVQLSLVVTNYRREDEPVLADRLIESGVGGLLVTPTIDDTSPSSSSWVRALPVPTIVVERDLGLTHRASTCSVRTDHEAGVLAALSHLRTLGHTRVALTVRHGAQASSMIRRAWAECARLLGLVEGMPVLESDTVKSTPSWDSHEINMFLDAVDANDCTAVLCHNDVTALAIIQEAPARGWAIPADLSLVAYDDEIAAVTDPPLTAVSPPKRSIGAAAVEMLLERIDDDTAPTRHLQLEPTLIARGSTVPPAHDRISR